MSKSTSYTVAQLADMLAVALRNAGMGADMTALVPAIASPVLSAGQKAAATKVRMKQEAADREAASLAAYAAMTPGQKAAHTKRMRNNGTMH